VCILGYKLTRLNLLEVIGRYLASADQLGKGEEAQRELRAEGIRGQPGNRLNVCDNNAAKGIAA
jgi:hypothetical protein